MRDSGENQTQIDDYFIPDLCRGQGLLGIFVIAALSALLMALLHSGIGDFDFLWLGKIALLVCWIALISAAFLCRARPYFLHLSLPRVALINYLLVLVAAALCGVVAEYWNNYSLLGIWQVDPLSILNTVVITAIPAGVILRLYYLQQRLHQQRRASLEARLQGLQATIRPHFLFNSMNSLATLIPIDAGRAEKTVENLCDLFRYALKDNSSVTLQEEVEACNRYLEIEKIRLEERLQYSWDIKIELNTIAVPALILQPLIENAVFHGVQPARQGGALYMVIYRREEWVVLDLINSLPDSTDDGSTPAAPSSGHQLALENLRCRLDAYFNGSAELQETVFKNHYHTRILFKPLEG